jgi:hypothetical protein
MNLPEYLECSNVIRPAHEFIRANTTARFVVKFLQADARVDGLVRRFNHERSSC